jgi:hypothetical protein
MSRVTLHRIEKGEPSVTIGSYLNLLAALGLGLEVVDPKAQRAAKATQEPAGWIPARIRTENYPQLKRVAWQVLGTDELTPAEAFGLYERNRRHLDLKAMSKGERDLVTSLRMAFGESSPSRV